MKWLKFLVSGVLLAWLASRTDWGQVGSAFAGMRWEFWLAALGLYAATQVVSAWRWQLLARPLGFERPLLSFVGFYFIGMFFNLLLPTSVGGDVVRAWYLDQKSGRRLAAFMSVLVDRGSGLLVLVGLACVATLLCPVEMPDWVPWMVFGTAGIGATAAAGLYLASFLRPASTNRDGDMAASRVAFFREQFAALLRRWPLLLGTTLLSVCVQAANVVLVWLVGQALGLTVPGIYYWVAVPMVTLLTLLPSISGMGVREWGMALFFTPLGVSPGMALSLSLLWFAVFAVSSLCGGLVYLFGRFSRPEADHGPVGDYSDQGRARQLGAAA